MSEPEREHVLDMLKYFHNDKGDMRRHVNFDLAMAMFPDVKRALEDYEFAGRMLKLVLEDAE